MVAYFAMRFFVFLFSLLGEKTFYRLVNSVTFLLRDVVKYRRTVILSNLKRCFPEKSQSEIEQIAYDYYRNLSTILLESMRAYSMGSKDVLPRIEGKDHPVVAEINRTRQTTIFAGAHYANWEWMGLFSGKLVPNHASVAFYRPLSNKRIDQWLKSCRVESEVQLASVFETTKTFNKHRNIPTCYMMIADQNPSNRKTAVWCDFFGQKTAWLHGIEKNARFYNIPVYFYIVRRTRDGHYKMIIEPVTLAPREEQPGMIITKYAACLEKAIREEPSQWLWSHKRFKMQYIPENNEATK